MSGWRIKEVRFDDFTEVEIEVGTYFYVEGSVGVLEVIPRDKFRQIVRVRIMSDVVRILTEIDNKEVKYVFIDEDSKGYGYIVVLEKELEA
jgi:hypothetical protein